MSSKIVMMRISRGVRIFRFGDGMKSPRSLHCFACLHILTAEMINTWNFAQFTSWFLTSMFHCGAKLIFWGLSPSAFFVTVRASTAYRKIWRLVNNFFCSHNKVDFSEIPTVLSNLLYHYFFHRIMAHFNFVISQNAKLGHVTIFLLKFQ